LLSLLDEVGVDVDDDDDDDDKEETLSAACLSAVCLSDEDTSEDAVDNDDDEEEVALPEPLAFFKGADWKSELLFVAPEMDPEAPEEIPVTAAELEDVVTATEGAAEGGTSADAAGVETAAGVLSLGNASETDKDDDDDDDDVFNDVVDIFETLPCPEIPLSSDVPGASSTATAPAPDTPSPVVADEATDLFALGAEFERFKFPLAIDLLEPIERSLLLPNI